jgi:hypothetical protein
LSRARPFVKVDIRAARDYAQVVPRLFTCLLPCALLACTNSTETTSDVGPAGPPSLAFADPAPGGSPACRAIGSNVTAHVPLLLSAPNVILRPPFACGAFVQCGYVKLFVNGQLNNEAAALGVDLLIGKLANPYHDGSIHAGTNGPDVLNLEVRLFENPIFTDDAGNGFYGPEAPMHGADGKQLVATTQIIVVPACP